MRPQLNEIWMTNQGHFLRVTESKDGQLCRGDVYKDSDACGWPLTINSNWLDESLIKRTTPEETPEYFL